MQETIRLQGMGETITSRRKKNEYEKKQPQHGRVISWLFRTKAGVDPFSLEGEDFDKINRQLEDDITEALIFAYISGSPQPDRIKQALAKAAQFWAEAVQDRIESGYLGENRKKAKTLKENLAKYGYITSEYGVPAPRGIRTGRWIEGIRHRWRQGRL